MSPSPIEIQLDLALRQSPAYRDDKRVREAVDEVFPSLVKLGEAGESQPLLDVLHHLQRRLEKLYGEISPEKNSVPRQFKAQFNQRLQELAAFNFIDANDDRIKGLGKDFQGKERWYKVPSWKQIRAAFTPEKLQRIAQLEDPILLLVPEGMPLADFIEKMTLPMNTPKKESLIVRIGDRVKVDMDAKGTCIAGATRYDPDPLKHGGTTKIDRLNAPGASGWQVLVVDGRKSSPQWTCEKSADDLLKEFRSQGFGGMSLEANFILQMHGKLLDERFNPGGVAWLLESYVTNFTSSPPDNDTPSRGGVVCAAHTAVGLYVSVKDPSEQSFYGARRSVRVL
ncbi:MAG: hypothetical protein UW70_C0090G0003 [Candidatus Peregrinibacteria bacterium GW2011_GWA2_44_7]|nr:MAG: hypothetical protein UW70_C0090G0003 [Candidatus Peregrinibacteria bacterium GW2011_GWA2_44_7]